MGNITKGLVGLAALAFALAVIGAFYGPIAERIPPESFSRACTNLALLAIAVHLVFKANATGSTS